MEKEPKPPKKFLTNTQETDQTASDEVLEKWRADIARNLGEPLVKPEVYGLPRTSVSPKLWDGPTRKQPEPIESTQ